MVRLPAPLAKTSKPLKNYTKRQGTQIVTQITEARTGLRQFGAVDQGVKGPDKTHQYQWNLVRPSGHRGSKNTSTRLPDLSLQVKGLLVAVPQIDHNWTPHRLAPPQT
jgi:hypothetical protein